MTSDGSGLDHMRPEDDLRNQFRPAGWEGANLTVASFTVAGVVVRLQTKAGHILQAQFDAHTDGWTVFGDVWLFGEQSWPCPLPRGIGGENQNVTRAEAEVAMANLTDVLLLEAMARKRYRSKLHATAASAVHDVVHAHDWTHDRVFAAVAWVLAHGWSIPLSSLDANANSNTLLLALEQALRLRIEEWTPTHTTAVSRVIAPTPGD